MHNESSQQEQRLNQLVSEIKELSTSKQHKYIQALFHYWGRVIYKYDVNQYYDTKKYIVNKNQNMFRDKYYKGINDIKKSITVECQDIKGIMQLNTLINDSLVQEISIVDSYKHKICDFSYSASFKIKNCTSNPEIHFFTKNEFHRAKIESLPSYTNMKFTCWNNISVNDIYQFFNNSEHLANDNESVALAQTVSLFLCESSRNPMSLLTTPLCFEMAEFWSETIYKNIKNLDKGKMSPENIKYPSFLDDFNMKQNEDVKDYITIMKQLGSNIEAETKYAIINNFFPMRMQLATDAARWINNQVNNVLYKHDKKHLIHKYDYQAGSRKDAIDLLGNEKEFIVELGKYSKSTLCDTSSTDDVIKFLVEIPLYTANLCYNMDIADDIPSVEILADITSEIYV